MSLKHGDTHNFGKRVQSSEIAGYISKPRPILWEWLLLSAGSQTRQGIHKYFISTLGISPFSLYPDLDFHFDGRDSGRVEMFSECLLPAEFLKSEDAYKIGQNIALMMWLGIDDLHNENVIVGRNNSGSLLFFPIDIESIFQDLSLPRQTLLIPAEELKPCKAGLADVLQNCEWEQGALAALCKGYWDGLTVFYNWVPNIMADLSSPMLMGLERRVRVILRPSQEYYDDMQKVPKSDRVYLPEEVEQMNRGDIPYFFLDSGTKELMYFKEPEIRGVAHVADLDLRKPINRIRSPEDFGKNRSLHMREFGVLQLIKNLHDVVGVRSVSSYNHVVVSIEDEKYSIKIDNRHLQNRL